MARQPTQPTPSLIAAAGKAVRRLADEGFDAEAEYLLARMAAAWPSAMQDFVGLYRAVSQYRLADTAHLRFYPHTHYVDKPTSALQDFNYSQFEVAAETLLKGATLRPHRPLPSGTVVLEISDLAGQVASRGQHWPAITIRVLANVMHAPAMRPPEIAIGAIADHDLARMWSGKRARRLRSIVHRFLDQSLYAEGATLLVGVLGVEQPTAPVLRHAWNTISNTDPLAGQWSDPTLVPMSRPNSLQRGPAPKTYYSSSENWPFDAESSPSPAAPHFEVGGSADSSSSPPPPTSAPPSASPSPEAASPTSGRHINAWIENAKLPLIRGRPYKFCVDIGALRAAALGSQPLGELNWRERDAIELLIVLAGPGFALEPGGHKIRLPRTGTSETALFTITPVDTGPAVMLRVRLFLAEEMALFQEFALPLAVMEAAAA